MSTTASVRSKIRLAGKPGIKPEEPITTESAYSPSMQKQQSLGRLNPLAELIDDETYALLEQHRLIDSKSLRDYHIRKSYREMRSKMSSSDAIDRLQQLHPYLQFDTIRKIVYQVSKAS